MAVEEELKETPEAAGVEELGSNSSSRSKDSGGNRRATNWTKVVVDDFRSSRTAKSAGASFGFAEGLHL